MTENPSYRPVTNHPLWPSWMEEGIRADLARYGVPLRLHHYTSWQGFKNIIQTRTLWASDSAVVNDPLEWTHGLCVVGMALTHITDSYRRLHANLIFDALQRRFGSPVFIACMSDSEQLESQWMGYADGGRGFAIALDGRTLSDMRAGIALRILPVEYDPQVQLERAREVVGRAMRHLDEIDADRYPGTEHNIRSVFSLLAVELAFLCATFKTQRWKAECEWRLAYFASSTADALSVQTRKRKGGTAVPYVSLDLADTWHGPHPIFEAVRIGPRTSVQDAREADRLLSGEQPPVIWSKHPCDPVPNTENIFHAKRIRV